MKIGNFPQFSSLVCGVMLVTPTASITGLIQTTAQPLCITLHCTTVHYIITVFLSIFELILYACQSKQSILKGPFMQVFEQLYLGVKSKPFNQSGKIRIILFSQAIPCCTHFFHLHFDWPWDFEVNLPQKGIVFCRQNIYGRGLDQQTNEMPSSITQQAGKTNNQPMEQLF